MTLEIIKDYLFWVSWRDTKKIIGNILRFDDVLKTRIILFKVHYEV